MRDQQKLLDDIYREYEHLRRLYDDAKRYIQKAEPHEALRPLNDGRNSLRLIEQRWEELRIMVERS